MGLAGREKILLIALPSGVMILLAVSWQWAGTIPLGIAIAVVLAPLHHRLSLRVPRWPRE